MRIITIDGNIGCGKTTYVNYLKSRYANNPNIVFLDEPVKEWSSISDENGTPMLTKFYGDQHKYAFPFQMMAYISRLKLFRDVVRTFPNTDNLTIVTERCLYSDKYVFAKMLHEQGKIDSICYKIYMQWFEEFAQDFPISTMFYIKTDPSICLQRINSRNRNGEEQIPLTYLNECHEYHEQMVTHMFSTPNTCTNTNVVVVSGNDDIDANNTGTFKQFDEWRKIMMCS